MAGSAGYDRQGRGFCCSKSVRREEGTGPEGGDCGGNATLRGRVIRLAASGFESLSGPEQVSGILVRVRQKLGWSKIYQQLETVKRCE